MDRYFLKIFRVASVFCLMFIGATISSNSAFIDLSPFSKRGQPQSPNISRPQIQHILHDDREEDDSQQLFLPFVAMGESVPLTELVDAWTEDIAGNSASFFSPEDFVSYHSKGINSADVTTEASLNWIQGGPCGISTIFSDTVNLSVGDWEHSFSGIAPDCTGIYTNTVSLSQNGFESTRSTQFEVRTPGTVVIGSGQAFDRCYLPSIELMQAWWDNSPYTVFNIYLGGISFFCTDDKVDSTWLQAISQQGWSFIPTWVGPQAPCTGFNHRMSSNASVAYQEGRAEADTAITEAQNLGMSDEFIIYYDMEGYPNNYSCRVAVKSFVRGWVERLHELGAKAGVYGAACTSYVADWDTIDPKPDDVWIAHWYTAEYDPDASVFGAPCVSDTMWSNHQRLKQYAGDHTETWGGLSLRIDSNVLDGEIYKFPPNPSFDESIAVKTPIRTNSNIQDMALVSAESGWVLAGQHLYWTNNAGREWFDITPQPGEVGQILAVKFLDVRIGWLLKRSIQLAEQTELVLFSTNNGGETWQEIELDLMAGQEFSIGSASLEFIDTQTGWISIKIQSSSNFSIGRLFSTLDGGHTWQEHTIPIGEPVRFITSNDGWTAGGPAGDQLYSTNDGGISWHPVNHPLSKNSAKSKILVDLPQFDNNHLGYLPITLADGSVSRLEVFISRDGGNTWGLDSDVVINQVIEPAISLPFDITLDGTWWVTSAGGQKLYASSAFDPRARSLTAIGLPSGIVAMDFFSDQIGWSLVNEGNCMGQKIPYGQVYDSDQEPLTCSIESNLFVTMDGGRTWIDVSP